MEQPENMALKAIKSRQVSRNVGGGIFVPHLLKSVSRASY
jgi:hypothetical protein